MNFYKDRLIDFYVPRTKKELLAFIKRLKPEYIIKELTPKPIPQLKAIYITLVFALQDKRKAYTEFMAKGGTVS